MKLFGKTPNSPPFTSKREQRLWLWTLAIIVAIYSTLELTGTLAGFLRENDLMAVAFSLGLLLAGAAVAAQWFKKRPGRGEIWVTLGVIAVYYMAAVRIESMEERTHLFEYSVVAIFIYQALSERVRNGRNVPVPALLAIVATALLGWLDEGIQAFLPNRFYDIIDVGFNALAGLMAVLASLALEQVRRWREQNHPTN